MFKQFPSQNTELQAVNFYFKSNVDWTSHLRQITL